MCLMGTTPGMEEMATEGTGEVDHRHHLIQMISLKGIRTVKCPERARDGPNPPDGGDDGYADADDDDDDDEKFQA